MLVAGASGLIGTELGRQLEAAGHTVQRLVRRPPRTADEFSWAPDAKILDFRLLESVDAVINLSGASLNRIPWTTAYKEQILRSRVKATEALVEGMAMAASPPPVFLSSSAVGFYGDRPGETLTEASSRGTGFLADVVTEWEAAARLAPAATRTVLLRTGVVLAQGGGALQPLTLATRFGLGSTVGHGTQHWPWIALHDEAAAIVHLLTSTLEGPVNLAGPTPATSEEITRRLASDLHRPHLLKLPEAVVGVGMGEMGRELLLPSQKVVPAALEADGFAFRYRTSDDAIDAALA
ncbi:TIGR01777 family oxidoreductase [Amnibacterium soli]|uniref:TIGR01777 family oxidoreductase n=1 Tax=Amnibacterium soli TaxID=1282736 RepID=A0ABP8YUT3_9MICO